MAQTQNDSIAPVKEKTFSTYNAAQGKAYAQVRRDYHPNVYDAIIAHHEESNGQFGTLLDVGCGPGLAIRGLSKYFTQAIGLDPSPGMIETASSLGGQTSTASPIVYETGTAEDLTNIQDGSVDLITAANAAHWFDMPRFWIAAARVLKPGGSVALWTSGDIRVHPDLPNAEAIQAAMTKHEEDDLAPYFTEGNRLARGGYADLPLPWTIETPVGEFEKDSFWRKEFEPGKEDFFTGENEADLETFEKMMASGSAEVRWREAHKEDVGTERDVIKRLRREIEKLLQEGGVKKGEERVKGAVRGVLLMVKKRA